MLIYPVEFVYDSEGYRTAKYSVEGDFTYVWEDGKIICETYCGCSDQFYLYDENGSPVAWSYNGVYYYYIKNQQGDILGFTDSNGNVIVTYTHDAWGKLLSSTGSWYLAQYNGLRYRGYYYDVETGLYYCQSRYYDPEVGRFLNADDTDYLNISGTVLGCNLYSYCENNVVNNEDPSGNFSIYSWTISIAIDAIIFWLAGWLNATCLGYMAPIKMMGKRSAAAFFAKNIAWRLKSITNSIINVAVKALIWIGKKAYAGLFNVSAKWAISALIREPLLIVTACTRH